MGEVAAVLSEFVGVGIVSHLSRGGEARRLAEDVCADLVSRDNGLMGCDGNHDLVHNLLLGLGCEWSVVLEDDAVPVAGFIAELRSALRVAPSPVVSLYLGRLRPPQYQRSIRSAVERADAAGADWIVSDRMYHGVGYAIRTELLESLSEFVVDLPVDERISEWVRSNNLKVSYTWPSLVDHADIPTVIERHRDGARRTPGRVAWRAAGHRVWSDRLVCVE